MPYDIVMKDGKHCVVKKDDGKLMGCHDTEDQAKAQMAAIHASETKAQTAEEAERRAYDAELRFIGPAEGKAGVGLLSGYAAVFGALSLELGSPAKRFRERIAPGAFRTALESGGNTLAFYHHGAPEGGPAMPLGSTRDGSLRLREDDHGLGFDLDLPDTTTARDLAELVRRGTVRGVSFAFPNRAIRDTWQNDGGMLIRTLHEIRTLIDVSPTHLPAYPDTALAVRSLERWEEERRTLSAGGEVSYEARQRALEAALRSLLGDPWVPGATYWTIRATFDASVVVERSGKLLSYPVAWKGPDPALGEPSPVQEVIQPVPAGAEASRRRRLRLAEVGLTGGDEAA